MKGFTGAKDKQCNFNTFTFTRHCFYPSNDFFSWVLFYWNIIKKTFWEMWQVECTLIIYAAQYNIILALFFACLKSLFFTIMTLEYQVTSLAYVFSVYMKSAFMFLFLLPTEWTTRHYVFTLQYTCKLSRFITLKCKFKCKCKGKNKFLFKCKKKRKLNLKIFVQFWTGMATTNIYVMFFLLITIRSGLTF